MNSADQTGLRWIFVACLASLPTAVQAADPATAWTVSLSVVGVVLVVLILLISCRGRLWTLSAYRAIQLDSDGTELLPDIDYDAVIRRTEFWSDSERQALEMSRAFEEAYPPGSLSYELTSEQGALIREKGVAAWEFEVGSNVNAIIQDRTEISFYSGECCVQTNLPLPRREPVYYFEVKMFDKPETTQVSVGVATKPYPFWRFPGRSRHSVGYHSNGRKYCNDPMEGKPYGIPFHEGDVIGCGYRTQSGTIFFTRNGVKLGNAVTGVHLNIFPTVAANGPCNLQVNFGQLGFVFIEANVKKWGLAPTIGNLLPPPAYGVERDSVLLQSGSNLTEEQLISFRMSLSNPENHKAYHRHTGNDVFIGQGSSLGSQRDLLSLITYESDDEHTVHSSQISIDIPLAHTEPSPSIPGAEPPAYVDAEHYRTNIDQLVDTSVPDEANLV
ncbi:SPRY-domain-containing protein [Basidiobolus meristosporus CBS 931.73]|uniref:SPRY-domain-containing protein n=1 Tax=Basidiobolus meristosporus CBS 931.73 TaxID=1314790 RepID=A0A1Y1YQ82_9FUNG|nr:SPRY-domain-containing protein [Basidiobolus meristosporus CBS 931.73]|eukprot:ORY00201.1 SPRY-domain-containing protein [Basidiobolus meristosporus CBS 931.73]